MNKKSTLFLAAISAVLVAAWGQSTSNQLPALVARMDEFPLVGWPKHDDPKLDTPGGSTHEITYDHHDGNVFWVTGQKHDALACVTLDGHSTFLKMPDGSGPHGILFDADGKLWVTLEFFGRVVQVDPKTGKFLQDIDVRLHAKGSSEPINTHPHGLGLGPTDTRSGSRARAPAPWGGSTPMAASNTSLRPTVGSVPIYIVAGPDGAMWCTELVGNMIARITADGKIAEYPIGPTGKRPDGTPNSRPIAITRAPDGKSMWFTEEAGNKIGRISMDGSITEFPVPKLHENTILAALLVFDRDGNLWTQAYIDPNNDLPVGSDAIVKIDKAITTAADADISSIPVTFYQVPTDNTVMHRILQGPDGAIWFTELAVDQVGRLEFIPAAEAAKLPPSQKNGQKSSPSPRKRGTTCCG